MDNKTKIAFLVREGLDNFIDCIISSLSQEYETKKVVVSRPPQIDEAMKWADICWFEWCDELLLYGSRLELAGKRKIICRLHSYEAFTCMPLEVNWENVDLLIFVAEQIRRIVIKTTDNKPKNTIVIPNGVDLGKLTFKERCPGFKIAYVGYINYKKGPMLLLHTINAIAKYDSRYTLHLAGRFQDGRDLLYFNQMVRELNLEDNIIFEGWQRDINSWLEDKNYIICTSILESQCMAVMEAMCKGIKPLIHNFVGAREIYPSKYIWNTIDQAVEMVSSKEYDSMEYRRFIEEHYELSAQIDRIRRIIEEM